ncbi:MAG: hypothetical protein ACFB2Z_10760 [Maricaulaceae bacterium]
MGTTRITTAGLVTVIAALGLSACGVRSNLIEPAPPLFGDPNAEVKPLPRIGRSTSVSDAFAFAAADDAFADTEDDIGFNLSIEDFFETIDAEDPEGLDLLDDGDDDDGLFEDGE